MPYVTQQSVLQEAGLWQRELAGAVAGSVNGTNRVFIVEHKPLTDTDYDDEITTDDVTAYVDDVEVSVSSVDEATGAITLASAPAADSVVTVDYSYSPLAQTEVEEIIEEAQAFIDDEMLEIVDTPYDDNDVPFRIRTITRTYAAGLLMIRYYHMQNNQDNVSVGEAKLTLAEKWLTAYRARMESNGSDAGTQAIPSVTSEGNLFQRYDSSNGRWEPLLDEGFTINRPED